LLIVLLAGVAAGLELTREEKVVVTDAILELEDLVDDLLPPADTEIGFAARILK
jgi:hypothetical protein